MGEPRRMERSIQPLEVEGEAAVWQGALAWLDRYTEHEPDLADGFLVVANA